jgi:hypothetical protein
VYISKPSSEAEEPWRHEEPELGENDVAFAQLSDGTSVIEAMFYAHLTERAGRFSRLDIQGAGPNTLGLAA